jgi:hypothetical protein
MQAHSTCGAGPYKQFWMWGVTFAIKLLAKPSQASFVPSSTRRWPYKQFWTRDVTFTIELLAKPT